MKSWAPTVRAAVSTSARGRVRLVVADVVPDRAGEEEGLLQHHRHVRSEVALAHVAHVVSPNPHRPAPHVVEAVDQRGHAGLARAGRAHQRHRLARLHPKRDVPQHRAAGHVAEGHVVELDRARLARQGRGAGGVAHGRRGTSSTSKMRCPAAIARCMMLYWMVSDRIGFEEALHVEQEGDHHPEFQLLPEHHAAAHHDHDRHRDAGEPCRRSGSSRRRTSTPAGAPAGCPSPCRRRARS